MKKKYIMPNIEIVKLDQSDIIATSGPGLGGDCDRSLPNLSRFGGDGFDDWEDW